MRGVKKKDTTLIGCVFLNLIWRWEFSSLRSYHACSSIFVSELDLPTPHGPLRKPSVLLYVKEWNFIYNLLKVAVVLNGSSWCSQLAPCIPNLECSSLKDNEMVILWWVKTQVKINFYTGYWLCLNSWNLSEVNKSLSQFLYNILIVLNAFFHHLQKNQF